MNLESIVQQRGQPQPYVLASGNINNCDQLFLIVDCEIVCEISVNVSTTCTTFSLLCVQHLLCERM